MNKFRCCSLLLNPILIIFLLCLRVQKEGLAMLEEGASGALEKVTQSSIGMFLAFCFSLPTYCEFLRICRVFLRFFRKISKNLIKSKQISSKSLLSLVFTLNINIGTLFIFSTKKSIHADFCLKDSNKKRKTKANFITNEEVLLNVSQRNLHRHQKTNKVARE